MGRILHDFYDDAALRILKTVHRALKPNGQIVIIEPLGLVFVERVSLMYSIGHAAVLLTLCKLLQDMLKDMSNTLPGSCFLKTVLVVVCAAFICWP